MPKRWTKKVYSFLFVLTLTFALGQPTSTFADTASKSDELEVDDEKLDEIKKMVEDQKSLMEEKTPDLDDELQTMEADDEDEEVSVIVQMSEEPVSLAKAAAKIKGGKKSIMREDDVKKKVDTQHNSLLEELEASDIDFEQNKKYDYVLNGMAITLKASDLDALTQMDGVVSVDRDEERYALDDNNADDAGDIDQDGEVSAQMDVSIPHLDVPDLWDDGIKGDDVKVAVLDTGIDYEHPEFEGVYEGGYNFVENDEDLYNEKRDDNDPYETMPGERPDDVPEVDEDGNEFYTSHGTHVAGTIAAQGNNDYDIKGVAPNVDLYAYRVLGAYGTGESSGIIDAIEKAAEENMDIINLSLGGGSNDQTAPDAVAINNAALDGVTPVISTGNSGPGRETIGNPSAAAYAISVGNSTLPETTFEAHLDAEAGNFDDDYNAALMAWEYGNDPDEALSGEYDVVPVPGVGEESDYDGLDVDGNVALVERGEIAFVDKIAAAESEGADGIIVYNNEEGEGPADESLGQSFDFIPTFDISLEDGEALREAIDESDDDVGTIDFSDYEKGENEGDEIDDTSSQGPTTPTFDVKPDIVAPGTNIMSSVPAYGKEFGDDADYSEAFDSLSGTSMAAPHVTGTAALLLSEHDDWDSFDVKVAMSNTAKQLDTDDYDVFTQGPGRIQPYEAANPDALAYVQDETTYPDDDGEDVTEDYEKGAVTFGRISPDADEETTVTRNIKVEELAGDASDYKVDVDVTEGASGELSDADVDVDKSSFTLDGEETLEATLTVPEGEEEAGNEILGYIYLESDTNKLTLPFAAEFSTEVPTGLEYYELDDEAISPNGDGVMDETELNFSLYDDQPNIIFELWSAEDPGPAEDHYIGFMDAGPVPAGEYILPVDGTYTDPFAGEKDMDDGVYSIDFNKYETPEEAETLDYAPLIVKTEEPEIKFDGVNKKFDDSDYTVSGTIDDEFIDFKETYEEAFDESFDVEDYLSVEYELADSDDEIVDDGTAELNQDGEFETSLSDLETDDYSFSIEVDDSVGNSGENDMAFQGLDISLESSTSDYTADPVTVEVENEGESNLDELKWLAGEKSAEDFADDGEDIMDSEAFEVDENNTYTVYAKDDQGLEALETIDIDNIAEPVDIDLEPETDDYTANEVTIDVSTDSDADLDELKWLPDEKEASDFDDEGNDILATGNFEATKNRTYTVYAQNEYGIEAVETIDIDNITDPVKIDLDPSTKEATDEPIDVDVDVDSVVDVTDLKWLPGKDKTAEDFEEDGTDILDEEAFEVDENGMYSVFAKNSEGIDEVKQIFINNIDNELSLKPSTEDPTDEPVSITVDSDHLSGLTELRWMQGDLDKEDFADGDGEDIDLEDPVFEVDENDLYTVYANNDDDIETVNHVYVSNIVQPVALELSQSPEDSTYDPVAIDVEVESDVDLKALRWQEGNKSEEDFKDRTGNDIAPDSNEFSVHENGTYTVYALSEEGYETTEVINVETIQSKEDDVSSEPDIDDGQASISDEDIDKLDDEGSLSVDLGDVDTVDVAFSAEQVKHLKEKDASLTIYNNDVEMVVPLDNLSGDSDVSFSLEQSDDDVDNAVSPIYDLTIHEGDEEIDEFKENVDLTLQIDTDKVDDTDNLDVYYFDENKDDWVRYPNAAFDDGEGQIGVDHFTKFAVLEKTEDADEEKDGKDEKDDEKDDAVKHEDGDNDNDDNCDCDTKDNSHGGIGKTESNGGNDDNGETAHKTGTPVQSGLHHGDKGTHNSKDDDGDTLPKTATPIYNYLLVGAGLILAGLIMLFIYRRKNKKETI